jgi:hypothetical protein
MEIADPNTPGLARSVWSPLQVPNGANGSLTFYGRYAIAQTSSTASYLEKCGTRLHRRLNGSPPVGNKNFIVWQPIGGAASKNTLDGLFLPGMKPFTIVLPSPVTKYGGLRLAASSRHLFVGAWATALPRAR